MNLRQLQAELAPWVAHNFGDRPWQQPLMGVAEEVGELNHALLKQWQGIRGMREEHEAAAKDAVADIVIYLADLCNARGWDFGAIVEETWARVSKRDWRADAVHGGEVER
jgi:NTP pyrophosphatase (non-canonical NTP hydrolase)